MIPTSPGKSSRKGRAAKSHEGHDRGLDPGLRQAARRCARRPVRGIAGPRRSRKHPVVRAGVSRRAADTRAFSLAYEMKKDRALPARRSARTAVEAPSHRRPCHRSPPGRPRYPRAAARPARGRRRRRSTGHSSPALLLTSAVFGWAAGPDTTTACFPCCGPMRFAGHSA